MPEITLPQGTISYRDTGEGPPVVAAPAAGSPAVWLRLVRSGTTWSPPCAAVRSSARRLLERQGYTVLEARHGAEALGELERRPTGIDLVISDVVMPEMGGRELGRRLTAIRPALPILFMSGYSAEELRRFRVSDLVHPQDAPDVRRLEHVAPTAEAARQPDSAGRAHRAAGVHRRSDRLRRGADHHAAQALGR